MAALVERNKKTIDAGLLLSATSELATLSPEDAAHLHTDRALMQLHNGDHVAAKHSIEQAIAQNGSNPATLFQKNTKAPRISLPAALWAIASLAEEHVKVEETLTALDYALAVEPDGRFAPIIVAGYLDRFLLRDDLLQPEHVRQVFESIRQNVRDDKTRAAAMLVVIYRSFVLLKLNQDFITTIAASPDRKVRKDQTRLRVERALHTYEFLLGFIYDALAAVRANDSFFMTSDANRRHTGELGQLLHEYRLFKPTLAKGAATFTVQ
jgi:hypothetical protein